MCDEDWQKIAILSDGCSWGVLDDYFDFSACRSLGPIISVSKFNSASLNIRESKLCPKIKTHDHISLSSRIGTRLLAYLLLLHFIIAPCASVWKKGSKAILSL